MTAAAKKKPTEAPFDPLPPSKSPPLGEFIDKRVPLKELHEDELNPRQYFDEAKLKELSATIDVQGLMDPIIVRPRAKGGFNITDGGRRYRALQMLPKEKRESMLIPVRVREITDSQYLEQALVKAGQREGLTELEEGATFARLRDQFHYSIAMIMEKTGKSRTVVFQRMKLASLQGKARKLLESGELSASVAEFIARMPTKEGQERALELITPKSWESVKLADVSTRRAKEILDREFNLLLSEAPFDVKDASLLTGCGACGTCPKRTGAEPDLFADTGKDDKCLDSECWKAKMEAGLAALKANGAKVVTLKHSDSQTLAKHGLARDTARPVGAEKSWRELLGKELPTAIVSTSMGAREEAVDVEAARALLEKKNPKLAAKIDAEEKKAESTDAKWKAQQKREAERREAEEQLDGVVATKLLASKQTLEAAAQLLVVAALNYIGVDDSLDAAGIKKAPLKPADLPRALLAVAAHLYADSYGSRKKAMAAVFAKAAKVDMKKLAAKVAKGKPGTCAACGCTEDKACDGGCDWANKAQTLCTACTGGEK